MQTAPSPLFESAVSQLSRELFLLGRLQQFDAFLSSAKIQVMMKIWWISSCLFEGEVGG